MSHPSATEIEDFVSGAVDPNADFVSHVSTCDACAELVRSTARVELALHDTGDAARFCVACGCVASTSRCSSCGAALSVRDYRVVAMLASGPLGRVYAAVDPSGVRVAVKELAFVGMARVDALEAFEREARVLERLTHPGIPRFVDSFSEGRGVEARAYLVQELIEGESLAARLARQQLSEPEVVEIARQVIEILVYLQSLSPMVFHRDIKPANLIQRPDGSIALVDFGAARDLGSTAGATVVGTFGYMPIEQLAGIVDATTDLHALGATLWHLCTRIEPWRLWADSLLQRRANVSPSLRRFLDKLVARDARRRFSGAVAARDALTASSGRWATLRPMLKWAAAAAVLIATTTGGFAVTRAHSWFGTSRGDGSAARTDELNRLAHEYGLKLAERALEHKVQLVDEMLMRFGKTDDDYAGLSDVLGLALAQKHLDGGVVLDLDGKVLARAGMIDPQGLAAERYTPPLAEPKASVRRIGGESYLVASERLTFFGRTGQLVVAEQSDMTMDDISPKSENSAAPLKTSGYLSTVIEPVGALVSGTLSELSVKVGDSVKSGQVLGKLGKTEVLSHLDGRVAKLLVTQGDRLTRGAQIAEIVCVKAQLRVNEEDLRRLQIHQPVLIEGKALARPERGQLVEISSEIDRSTADAEVFVQLLDPEPELRSGTSVQATFEEATNAANDPGLQAQTSATNIACPKPGSAVLPAAAVLPAGGVEDLWQASAAPAPSFALRDLTGKTWRLQDLAGKTVIATLWATWCEPCKMEIPDLKRLVRALASNKDVVFLSMNVDSDASAVAPFVKEQGIDYPVLLSGEAENPFLKDDIAIPLTLIIDKHGQIRGRTMGFHPELGRDEWIAATVKAVKAVQ